MEIKIPKLIELPKECPFCHGEATIVKDKLWNGSHGYIGNYEYYIACKNEDCFIKPKTKSRDDIYGKSEEECLNNVIRMWNKR